MSVVVLVGGGRHDGWRIFASHLPSRWSRVLIVDRGRARVRDGWNARWNLLRHGILRTRIARDLRDVTGVDGVWFCGGTMDELLPLVTERERLRHVRVIGGSSAGARLLGYRVNDHRRGLGIVPGCVGVHGQHPPCPHTTLLLRTGEVHTVVNDNFFNTDFKNDAPTFPGP